jgi:hypothetical protein
MINENETRSHPIWHEVAGIIAQRVEENGYGFLLTWEELSELLEFTKFQQGMNQKEFEQIQFDRMKKIENLKDELLEENNILLFNDRNKGYIVLEPDVQVDDGWKREVTRWKKHLHKALKILNHVDFDKLSDAGVKTRDRHLNKTVFVLSASNRRNIPDSPKHKQIA